MKCPYCKQDDDKVVDSRSADDGAAIRRRRECLKCGRRYTTYERMEEIPLRVIKKDGRREPFDRAKILAGLMRACEKRPVPTAELDRLTQEIETAVAEQLEREVPSSVIGEHVMHRLRQTDQVAYVRFASVYREFKDANQFLEELRSLLAKGGDNA